jgi:two-component system nitrate/nitrite response regulator NarL
MMRVLIVDDQRLFADVICSALESRGVQVVGVAGDAKQALDMWRATRPDVVLVDVGLPDESGVEVGKRILAEHSGTKVLIVTALNDARVVGDALRAGFAGYLTKDTPLSRFLEQIEAALRGEVVVPHRISAGANSHRTPEQRHASFLAEQLSVRELDVLRLLAEGAQTGDMARRLEISTNTVRTHVQSILTKLQVHSRLEAATFAVRFGIVSSPNGSKR